MKVRIWKPSTNSYVFEKQCCSAVKFFLAYSMAGSYKLLVFIVVISKCIAEEEPRCSKYHFEEKVLEKMVRMEHSNGIMMDDFKELATRVKESLETMKREFEEMKRQAEEKIEQCGHLIEGSYLAASHPVKEIKYL